MAPPIDRSIATTIYTATQFLYTGGNPIQTGVAPGTIQPQRVAVLRGMVLTRDGLPLSGVAIAILSHPELGRTLSRADGRFDLAVNGGGPLTVTYRKPGYLPAQRQVHVPWQDYAALPDVVLIQPDATATTIDVSPGSTIPMQVARGNQMTDLAGTRRATVLFPQGTTASLVQPDGTTRPTSRLTVRLTEFTVGSTGQAAMPAELPPTTAYTYAVGLDVDEAVAKVDGRDVVFNQPVVFYVENFVGLPVGMAMPVGYYDDTRGAWVASRNGRIIRILGVTSGLADVDTNGDGAPDDPATLAVLGITDPERQQLAGLYQPGQTLWRAPIPHFSLYDLNSPVRTPPGAILPSQPVAGTPKLDEVCRYPGSTIECQTQILGETLDIVGSPFTLHYASDRVPGHVADRTLEIPLSGASVPSVLLRIDLEVRVAGLSFRQSFPAAPNQRATFTWDGIDAYGRILQGQQPATTIVGYAYEATAGDPSPGDASFGLPSALVARLVARLDYTELAVYQVQKTTIGPWDQRGLGLGGWSLSAHHAYDPAGRVLYLGDGTRRSADNLHPIIRTAAGTGVACPSFTTCGEGGPATQATLTNPIGVAAGADGSFYILEASSSGGRAHIVWRVGPDGIITTVAGGGNSSAEGIPATQALLPNPQAIALGPDGTLYITAGANRIRRVGADGLIRTVAGNGSPGCIQGTEPACFGGDGGPATQAALDGPIGIALGPDGTLFIADVGNHRIRRVGTDGIITTAAGTGQPCSVHPACGEGGAATRAPINAALYVAAAPDGSFYFSQFLGCIGCTYVVMRVSPDGILTRVAGGAISGGLDDGIPATQARLLFIGGIALGPDGSIFITQRERNRARRVMADGTILTVAGSGIPGAGDIGDGGPATQARTSPAGIAVRPDGGFYLTGDGVRVREVRGPLPGFAARDIALPSEDGRLLYRFDQSGRHLSTVNALTGAVLLTFGYDAGGRLSRVTDADGNVTTIERDGSGNPTGIVGPFGQRTTLGLDANGFLASVANPAGERTGLGYTADGLLTSLTTPRGHLHQFAYDTDGRLTRDTEPASAGGSQALQRTDLADGHEVTRTTALNRTTRYSVERLPSDVQRQVNTFPDGTRSQTSIGTDESRTATLPDGTTGTTVEGPDPRFGMQAPLVTSGTTTTPGGLRLTTATERTVTLTDPANPLSLTAMTDATRINGRAPYTSAYAAASRTFTNTTPLGRQTTATTDVLGRMVSAQLAGLDPANFTYDGRGRLATTTQGAGATARTTTLSYNAEGYAATIGDALGRTASFRYDDAGRVASQTLPDGGVIAYTYDASGNLASITPPGRTPHNFAYNTVDLPTEYAPPAVAGSGTTSTLYTYNADRQVSAIQRPDGARIDYTHDAAGRLGTLTYAGGSLTYGYSATTGQLATIAGPGAAGLAYVYDGPLVTQTTWSGPVAGRVGRTYDNDFRLTSLSVNGADPIAFQYDADGLLTQAGSLALARSAQNGLLTGTTLGSLVDNRTYNGLGEVIDYAAAHSDANLLSVQYTYDRLGRITQKIETVGGVTDTYEYGYDLAGRLEQVRRGGATIATHAYDTNGNRTSFTGPGGTVNGTYDAQDRLIQYGSITYTYTADGELLTKANGAQTTTYQYDALGNLTRVALPTGTQIDYVVDGRDRRIGKQVDGVLTQGFLYQDGLEPVAELDGSNAVVSRFVYGTRANVPDYMVKGGVTYRLVTDHLGSVRLVVDAASGAVVQRLDYDEFGRILQDTNPGFQPFGFAGGLNDRDTGLVRFGARDYDPETGRWTAKDRVGFAGRQTNLYAYVDNDPANAVDSTGLGEDPWWLEWLKGVSGIAVQAPVPGSDGTDVVGVGVELSKSNLSYDFFYNKLVALTTNQRLDASTQNEAARLAQNLCDFAGKRGDVGVTTKWLQQHQKEWDDLKGRVKQQDPEAFNRVRGF